DRGQCVEIARHIEHDLLVLVVEAGGRLYDLRLRGITYGLTPAEIEQQPLQAQGWNEEVRISSEHTARNDRGRDWCRHMGNGTSRLDREQRVVGSLRQPNGNCSLPGTLPSDACLRIGALRNVDELSQPVRLLRINRDCTRLAGVLALGERRR